MNKESTFEKELENLINKYNKENGSDTPDFILAEYLLGCLETWNNSIKKREKWYDRVPKEVEPPITLKDILDI